MNFEWIVVLIAVGLFGAMLALLEIGYRIGRRRRMNDEAVRSGAGVIEAAVFTLLGLLLGFQFAGAAGRLDARRQIIVSEANSIGTAYLRLDLLPADAQPSLRELFRRYTDHRIAAYADMSDLRKHDVRVADAAVLQKQIWLGAIAAASGSPDPRATMLLIPALNEMIDLATTREVSVWTHAPPVILGLLGVLALLSALLAGNAMAASPDRQVLHRIIFAAVTAIAIFVVLDLEFPRAGLIRIGAADQAMLDTRKSMD